MRLRSLLFATFAFLSLQGHAEEFNTKITRAIHVSPTGNGSTFIVLVTDSGTMASTFSCGGWGWDTIYLQVGGLTNIDLNQNQPLPISLKDNTTCRNVGAALMSISAETPFSLKGNTLTIGDQTFEVKANQ